MGKCKKVKFCYLLTFLLRSKNTGHYIRQKICDETKILSGIWIADHGRDATGDRAEILIVYGFKTILTIYGLYIKDITVICGYINNI